MRAFLLLLALCLMPALAAAQSQPARTQVALDTDPSLTQFLKRWEPVFGALERCVNERIIRAGTGRNRTFIYRARCGLRSTEQSVDAGGDCSYDVEASGTIDSPDWATVRRWRLNLVCSG